MEPALRLVGHTHQAVCGQGHALFPAPGVGEFRLEAGELHPGDEVVLIGKTTGTLIFNIEQLRLDVDPVPEVRKGDLFSMPVPEKIRPGDRLYLWQQNE